MSIKSLLHGSVNKQRLLYFLLTILTIPLGLGTRSSIALPSIVSKYGGDVLWALLVYWGIRFLFPTHSRATLYTLLFSFSTEISQLYQADWINHIRDTRLGALVLGFGFLWSDLACYTLGACVGTYIDKAFFLKMFHKD